ncbi:Carbonyl reductase [NADPH] 3 [Armadillidium vulgare]|nr:Carbonyl reductase [NADPH] 3 [Armadillidium vulgare]
MAQRICIDRNKGIGFGIVKDLCKKFDGLVYLTSRDESRGKAAVEALKKDGLTPQFHQLDISDEGSVKKFVDYLKTTYGGVDVVVNNAAIAFKTNATEPFHVQAKETLKVNYFDTKSFCNAIFPILRPHGRVVNVSSCLGHLSCINGKEPNASNLRKKLASTSLTENDLDELINYFISSTKDGDWSEKGWPNSTYVVSKVGLSALTRIQQRSFDADSREDLIVNSCHPGYVDTDMTSHKGILTIEEGAVCPVYLALLPPNVKEPKGAYLWRDTTIVDWVTGSNKGIGFGIVKDLCKKFDGLVYLTSRDESRGKAAVEALKKDGLTPQFHQLDISDEGSVKRFVDYLKTTYGGVDVVVNNAATAFKMDATEPFHVQAKETLKVNYFDTKNFCNAIFPILRPHGRVVNVSSSAGHLSRINGKEPNASNLRKKLSSTSLTENDLDGLMNDFISSTKDGNWSEKGWPNSTYVVSKVGLSALTRIQQRSFDADSREDLIVNSCHPGYVDTDMTSHKGTLTVEEGAVCPVYLALLPPNIKEPKGAYFWKDTTIVDWVNGPLPGMY